MGKATKKEIRETLKKAGAKVISTQHLEKGGMAINMEGKNALAKMSNLKDWFADNKLRIHIPKNILQGCAKVFIRNYNATTSAEEIVTMIEEAGVRVVDLYLIRNKQTGHFTGLVKSTLLGNKIMNKWLEDKKANLGGVRRPIERERKNHACNNCFRFNHKMDKYPYGKQCRKCGSNDHIATEC